MHGHLDARLSQELSNDGLSYPEYLVLATLSDAPRTRCRLVELARELGWETSRTSHQVTRMCRRALVAKRNCPTDRRGAFVVLTDEGRHAIAAAAPHHVDLVRYLVIDACTPEQLQTLDAVSRAILGRLRDEPSRAGTTRPCDQ